MFGGPAGNMQLAQLLQDMQVRRKYNDIATVCISMWLSGKGGWYDGTLLQ